jgi:hypothetical protein
MANPQPSQGEPRVCLTRAEAFIELSKSAARLAWSADIKGRAPEASGGHSVYEDIAATERAILALERSRG